MVDLPFDTIVNWKSDALYKADNIFVHKNKLIEFSAPGTPPPPNVNNK